MSHFWRDVQWWEDWQLRFLVLASLAFQYFLFVAALLRKRRIPHWFRVLVWLSYLGGDIVAVYALATLFNSHKKVEMAAGGAHLDILWAPVLLLHLGGQDGITAYSIEDNENWRRHLLTAVSQITIAIYVFVKSWWFRDERLLRASILLFVPGVIKCLEKPWALRNATVTSIADSSDPQMTITLEEDDGLLPTDVNSLGGYVKAARKCVDDEARRDPPGLFFDDKMNDEPYHLFVDLAHPYSVRLKNLQVMVAVRGRVEAHDRVRAYVSRAFDRLYTKHKASYGGVLRAIVVLLTFADIGLFEVTRRRRGESSPYARDDVVVTYVLLCCTAALELVSASVVLGSGLPVTDDKAAQYNLVGYLARKRRRPWIRHLAFLLGIKSQLEWLWCTAPPQPTRRVTDLVYNHVAGGWKGIESVDDYRQFNDSRGQRTLERAGLGGGTAVAASLRMPFDESVLVWHLATELCYFDHVDTGSDATRHGRVISNYMAYLLFAKPWMLIPGARRGLFRAVYIELRKKLKEEPSELEEDDEEEAAAKKKASPTAMGEIARKIIQELRNPPTSSLARPRDRRLSAGLVHKAWALAYELMEFATKKTEEFMEGEEKPPATEEEKRKAAEAEKLLTAAEEEARANRAKKHGDERMWEVIQGVWVEMLCFSAGRCRGHLHARSLGKGGEYLSYVWLLLSYMGMETMAERMQRTELGPVEGDAGALVETSDPDDDDEDDDEPGQAGAAAPGAAAAAVAPAAMAVSVAAVVPVLGDDNNV